MTKLTRKLLISVFTLAFALVTLGATTFAWFTLQSTASIDTISTNVVTGQGIEISVDGKTYVNKISLDDIIKQIGYVPKFDSVTSKFGYDFFNMNYGDPEAKNYLEFKLWFRSPTQDARVYLDDATKTDSIKKSWVSDAVFTYNTSVNLGQTIDIYAANSLRFSFEQYMDGVEGTGDDAYSFANPKTERTPSVYEINPATIAAADSNITLGTRIPQVGDAGLVSYWNSKLKSNILQDKVIVLPDVVYDRVSGIGAVTGEPNHSIAVLSTPGTSDDANYYGYMMVRVWLEGWDPDNFDAVLNANLSITFAFSVADPGVKVTSTGDVTTLTHPNTLLFSAVVTDEITQTVTWSSSNSAVATVDAATGELTTVAKGFVTITATSTVDGSKVGSKTIEIK